MAISMAIRKPEGLKVVELTPIKAIRHKCLECSAWQPSEVRLCHMDDCPLWPFRFGNRPKSLDEVPKGEYLEPYWKGSDPSNYF